MTENNKSNIEILLKKFLYNRPTYGDRQQLADLLADSENMESFKKALFDQLADYNEEQHNAGDVDFDGIYSKILIGIKQNESSENEILPVSGKLRIKRILIFTASMAAVFVIAFSLGNLFPVYRPGNMTDTIAENSYSVIKAPLGSKSEVRLPDGSRVVLNAGSSLKYRSDFNITNRDLILSGEGYFTVAKNADIPLNVSAGNINIKAVGTEFNVKAYDEDGIIETTLVEGKVKISQKNQIDDVTKVLDLDANQKAIYIKESESFSLENIRSVDSTEIIPVNTLTDNLLIAPRVDVTQVVAWTQGKLIIRGESLDNLCVELQRKYNVNFIFNNEEIKKYRFSGILLDETLEQVMTVIKLTAPIDFYLVGKTVFLSSNDKQLNNYSKHLK